MKILHIFMLFTISSFAETYISGSVINNSIITNGTTNNRGDTITTSKNINTSSFSKIDIDIPADVTINRASRQKIAISTDKAIIDKIKIYVKKDTLFIRTKGSFQSSTGINITLSNPHLTHLTIDGASTIKLNGFNEKSFSLIVDGASDVIFANGSFDNFVIKADGSYGINLLNVTIKEAKVEAEGSGDIKINVRKYLKVDLKDTVDLKYKGHPKIKKSIEDVSDVSHI